MIANWYNNFMLKSSMTALEYKTMDLKRWGKLHIILAKTVGLDLKTDEGLSQFMDLSDVFRELTDRLKRLPTRNEFISAWNTFKKFKTYSDN